MGLAGSCFDVLHLLKYPPMDVIGTVRMNGVEELHACRMRCVGNSVSLFVKTWFLTVVNQHAISFTLKAMAAR